MRSRSPQEDNAGKPVPSAEKATEAPVFVEPGSEGDVAGVLPNSQRVFEYLAHLEQVVNDHAELLNASDAAGDSLRRRVEQQSLETAHVKEVVTRADGVTKQAIEEQDHRLRQDTAKEIHGVWEFLTNNNAGIRQLFNEADNAVAKLVQNVDEMKGRVDNLENKPSTVAAGPKGLAFVGLRADLKKLEEKMEARAAEFNKKADETNAAVNAAFTAAGPVETGQTESQAMKELEKLEEAMEDRFALLQVQV
jgi:hypothetical protein